MSLASIFKDAFDKVAARRRKDALEHARSDGVLGPTNQNAQGAFDPIKREAPQGGGSPTDAPSSGQTDAR
jgi:hypothetical protein